MREEKIITQKYFNVRNPSHSNYHRRAEQTTAKCVDFQRPREKKYSRVASSEGGWGVGGHPPSSSGPP